MPSLKLYGNIFIDMKIWHYMKFIFHVTFLKLKMFGNPRIFISKGVESLMSFFYASFSTLTVLTERKKH